MGQVILQLSNLGYKFERWRAYKGEYYYFFDGNGGLDSKKDFRRPVDDERYQADNYFKTTAEARAAKVGRR